MTQWQWPVFVVCCLGNFTFLFVRTYRSRFPFKRVMSWFVHPEKFSPNFSSSSFVIRVNLLHPEPSLFLYGLLFSFWGYSTLVNFYFQVSFNLSEILHAAKITQSLVTELLQGACKKTYSMSKISRTIEYATKVFGQANRKSKKKFRGEGNAPELPKQWRRNFADKFDSWSVYLLLFFQGKPENANC